MVTKLMVTQHKLNQSEQLDWLQLIRTPTIGPITFHRLIAKYGSAADALAALPELARKAGRQSTLKAANRRDAEREIKKADQQGARLIASCENDYPKALAQIPDAPPILYLRGHANLFEKPSIAIIGARNASGIGRKIARSLAVDLGRANVVVTSGLARGIDAAAHASALETGTIAVVAGGVDVVYPPEHDELTSRIAREGALISECAMGRKPTARDFPKRNRLISGLSHGVLVVEAAAKSGTLITARFALEQGREVFAVPGSPLDPRCQGANRLIRDGATLVETADDVMQVLAAQHIGVGEKDRDLFGSAEYPDGFEPTAELTASLRTKISELLAFTPLHRDEILREIGSPPGLVADALLELVLSGAAIEHDGGRFSLPSPD